MKASDGVFRLGAKRDGKALGGSKLVRTAAVGRSSKSTTAKPVAAKPVAAKPVAAKPVAAKTAAAKTAAAKTAAAKTAGPKTAASPMKSAKRTTPVAGRTTTPATVAWKPDVRADQVVSVLGNKRAAKMLSVSESQPSRWRNAQEVPSPQVAPALVDLDHIIARLQLVWDDEVIGDWLEGPNAFLEGARPIDVLLVHGSVQVMEAIEAEASGAYA